MSNAFEIFWYCFRLGLTGFGGPLAIISQIHRDLVQGRSWLTEEDFQRAIPLIKSMPGPVAFQTLVHVTKKRSNALVATIASILFILPSFVMMIYLADSYDSFKSNSDAIHVLAGMQAGALILILLALKDLSKPFVHRKIFWLFLLSSLVLMVLVQIPEPIVIIGMGLLSIWSSQIKSTGHLRSIALDVFLICFKAGAIAFGTGLSIVPLLQGAFTRSFPEITNAMFLDALAFGQLTPGPVVITVTFLGYKLAGMSGAVFATLGIFLPSWFHMVTWFSRVEIWMSKQKWIKPFLLGATAALCAGIGWSIFILAKTVSVIQMVAPIGIFLVFYGKKIPGWLLILSSGTGYWIIRFIFL